MNVNEILETIMTEKKMSKAQLGRAIGIVTPEEADEKPSKASDIISKRMKQKNISLKLLAAMLKPLGYTIAVVPIGQKLREGEYEVNVNE